MSDMRMSEHKDAAVAWVECENTGPFGGGRGSRLIALETPDAAGVVTLDADTGECVVWSVGYAARKVNGCYRRLTPKAVREVRVSGESWRERRDAARVLRVRES